MNIFKKGSKDDIFNSTSIGVFLDIVNIAYNSEGILTQALDYIKLRQYLSLNFGKIVFSIACFDGPMEENKGYLGIKKFFNNVEYSELKKELVTGGWEIDEGPLLADVAIPRDYKQWKHLIDFPVLLSRDRQIVAAIKGMNRKSIIFLPKDLISSPTYGDKFICKPIFKDDVDLQFINKALEVGQKDIAAVLLGVRLERIIDNRADSFGYSSVDNLYRSINLLLEKEVINSYEYKELNKYRKLRNSAVHGAYRDYLLDDVTGFYKFLKSWNNAHQ